MDGTPFEKPEDNRNSHAVALGKAGRQKGRRSQIEKLSPVP